MVCSHGASRQPCRQRPEQTVRLRPSAAVDPFRPLDRQILMFRCGLSAMLVARESTRSIGLVAIDKRQGGHSGSALVKMGRLKAERQPFRVCVPANVRLASGSRLLKSADIALKPQVAPETSLILAIASSRVKLLGFWIGGKSLKVAANFLATAVRPWMMKLW